MSDKLVELFLALPVEDISGDLLQTLKNIPLKDEKTFQLMEEKLDKWIEFKEAENKLLKEKQEKMEKEIDYLTISNSQMKLYLEINENISQEKRIKLMELYSDLIEQYGVRIEPKIHERMMKTINKKTNSSNE